MPLNSRETLDPTRVVTVLLLSPDARDHILIRHVFDHSNWVLHQRHSIEEGVRFVRDHPLPVVITEERLAGANWRDVLHAVGSLAKPPKLIVTSDNADATLWAEVINLGGYDVLAKPWNEREMFHAVSQAWLAWKHEAKRPVSDASQAPQYYRAAV